MLLVKRLGELRRLEKQLQTLRRSSVSRSGGARLGSLSSGVVASSSRIASKLQQQNGEVEDETSDAAEDARAREWSVEQHTAQTNKIMFRQLPIVFSLIERTLAQQMRVSRRRANETNAHRKKSEVHKGPTSLEPDSLRSSTAIALHAAEMEPLDAPMTRSVSQKTVPRPARLLSVKDAKMLLRGLHSSEEARKQHYDALYANAVRGLERNAKMRGHVTKQVKQCKKRKEALQSREYERKLGLKSNSGSGAGHAQSVQEFEEKESHLEAKLEHLNAERQELLDDISVLQQSVLARPYLSANMWRKLLDSGMWVSLMRDLEKEKQACALMHTYTAAQRPSHSKPNRDALALLLVLTRLVLGVLRHVVVPNTHHQNSTSSRGSRENVNAINRRSPRFVVSMPSRKKRRQKRNGAIEQDAPLPPPADLHPAISQDARQIVESGASEDTDAQDLLSLMLSGASGTLAEVHALAEKPHTPKAATQATQMTSFSRKSNNVAAAGDIQLRWMPPGETDVLPLVKDTLDVVTAVLERVSCSVLVSQGCASELFELFATVQTLTTSFLYLVNPTSEVVVDADVMHAMLQRLERTLESGAKEACSQLQESISPPSSAAVMDVKSSPYENLSYEKSARLILAMNSMQLFSMSSSSLASSRRSVSPGWSPIAIVSYLTVQMFPFLATNTLQALESRARQTSLYAFTTRGFRAKTQRGQDTKSYYSSKDALTAVQEARLQRRRMAATLREGKLAELQNSYVQAVARTFALQSLCTLFNVYVRVWMISQDGSQFTKSSTPAATRNANEYRIFMGSIFIADALVQRALTRPSESESITLMDMSTLLMSACTMWPEVSRQLDAQQQHTAGRSSPRKRSSESETLVRFIGFILESENEVLAARIQQLQPALVNDNDASDMSRTASTTISLQSLRFMVFASNQLASLTSFSEVGKTARGGVSGETLHLLQVQGSLLRTLLNSDSQLWQAAREHKSESIALLEQLGSELTELWHKLGIADSSVTAALQKLESIRSRLN